MLSLDRTILEKDSAVQKRLIVLAEALGMHTPPAEDGSAPLDRGDTTTGLGDLPTAGRLGTPLTKGEVTVCVPGPRTESVQLSEHLRVHAAHGPKPLQFFGLWLRARQELTRQKYNLITVQDAIFSVSRHSSPRNILCHWKCNCTGLKKWKEDGRDSRVLCLARRRKYAW